MIGKEFLLSAPSISNPSILQTSGQKTLQYESLTFEGGTEGTPQKASNDKRSVKKLYHIR